MNNPNTTDKQPAIALERDGPIATLTLGRAHCLDIAGKQQIITLLDDLAAALAAELRPDTGALRALVLRATHPGAWLVNVEELAGMPPAEARQFSHHGHRLARAIAELPVPVIAAVDGPALGGGCELVLACDLALAGEHAQFGQIEALGGVMPAFGGSWRLEERVGYQRAMAMLFTGQVVDAFVAKSYGIVLETHPSSELLDAAARLAAQIAACSGQSIAAIKRLTRAGRGMPAAVKDQLEEEAFPLLFGDEQRTRMHAFLQQQRESKGV